MMRDSTTFTPLAPGATGSLVPSMSPFWDMALPDLDTRAATTTLAWLEIVAPGAIAMLSSSVKR